METQNEEWKNHGHIRNMFYSSVGIHPAKIGHLKIKHLLLSVKHDEMNACINLYSFIKLH